MENALTGHVTGSVVQAGSVGQVVLSHREGLPVPRQLPPAPTRFVGRADELTRLTTQLAPSTGVHGALAICALAPGKPGNWQDLVGAAVGAPGDRPADAE